MRGRTPADGPPAALQEAGSPLEPDRPCAGGADGSTSLVAATSRWIGLSPRIEVTLHEPLPKPARNGTARDDFVHEIVGGAVRWFERHLRAHPEDLRPVNIRDLLRHLRAHTQARSDEDFARLAEEFAAGDGQ